MEHSNGSSSTKIKPEVSRDSQIKGNKNQKLTLTPIFEIPAGEDPHRVLSDPLCRELSDDSLTNLMAQTFDLLDLLTLKDRLGVISRRWVALEKSLKVSPSASVKSLPTYLSPTKEQHCDEATLEVLRKELGQVESESLLKKLIEKELENIGFLISQGELFHQFNNAGKLKILLKKVQKRLNVLEKVNLIDRGLEIYRKLDYFLTFNIKKRSKEDKKLSYILRVQQDFTTHDVFCLIQNVVIDENEQTTIPANKLSFIETKSGVSNKDQLPDIVNLPLKNFTLEYSTELRSKFELFANESSNGFPIAKVCDFMTLMKIIFQDYPRVRLLCPPCAEREENFETSIFQDMTTTKNIFEAINRYYEESLRVDGSLEGNSPGQYGMDFYLFIWLVDHLLEAKLIIWKYERLEDEEPAVPGAKEPKFSLKANDPNRKILVQVSKQMKKMVETGASFGYQIISAISDFKLLLDAENISKFEQKVCQEILDNLRKQLTRLQLFKQNFSKKELNRNLLMKEKKIMEELYGSVTQKSNEEHIGDIKSVRMDFDQYRVTLEVLKITNLLPDFSTVNFSLFFYIKIDSTQTISFTDFLNIIECLINKIIERKKNTNFGCILTEIIHNYQISRKKGTNIGDLVKTNRSKTFKETDTDTGKNLAMALRGSNIHRASTFDSPVAKRPVGSHSDFDLHHNVKEIKEESPTHSVNHSQHRFSAKEHLAEPFNKR